ncbi:MAG: hypothetical protein HQL51_07120 [Magnetococcales bacterium]|nr:hypothetical protein [Magnetococcales bacterium]
MADQRLLPWPLEAQCTLAGWISWEGAALARGLVDQALSGALMVGLIVGPEGSGKTHLLRAAVAEAEARWGVGAGYYWAAEGDESLAAPSGDGEEILARRLEATGAPRLLALDRVERLTQAPGEQEWAFHLFNRVRRTGGAVLWAGREDPARLPGLPPELRSRILWGAAAALAPPGEEMLSCILGKLARDRQVLLSEELTRFLALRLPRRVAAYQAALDLLDREGLRQQRPLTIPLARQVLEL